MVAICILGRLIGHDLKKTDKYVKQGASRTFLFPNIQIGNNGYITEFWAYFTGTGKVQFQIWRPQKLTTNPRYLLIGQKDFYPGTIPKLYKVFYYNYNDNKFYLSLSSCLQ